MSKLNSLYVSLLALVVAVIALAMCIHCCAKKQSVSVEETLNNNPEIIINAMQNYEQKMREQAIAEAQKMIEKAHAEIKEEKEKVIGEIRDEAANLAIYAASKLISESLDDDAHKKLVDKYIEEAGEVQ